MPRYDFQCIRNGHVFEENVSWDATVAFCPQCNNPAMRLPHYHTLRFTVPLSFHTDTREVLGPDVKEQLRKGEIVPAPGNRWA